MLFRSSRDQLTLDVSGLAGNQYELGIWNPAEIASLDGGVLTKSGKLQVQIPIGPDGMYMHQKVVIHFKKL